MNSATININARYRLEPWKTGITGDWKTFDVIDRARELQFLPAVIFSNGTEKECREWVLRNCEEPVEHTKGDWAVESYDDEQLEVMSSPGEVHVAFCNNSGRGEANAHLISTSPRLLALLEKYHQSFPTKESGKLICEAKGWTI